VALAAVKAPYFINTSGPNGTSRNGGTIAFFSEKVKNYQLDNAVFLLDKIGKGACKNAQAPPKSSGA
jgi:hypothetical protein